MTLVFLHGLETGPLGSKYQILSKVAPTVAPDCTGVMDLATRVAIVKDALQGHENLILVGSSFGGLVAVTLLLQDAAIERRTQALLLCAPALHLPSAPQLPTSLYRKTTILHGKSDDVIPLRDVQQWARQNWVTQFDTIEDEHRLAGDEACAYIEKWARNQVSIKQAT